MSLFRENLDVFYVEGDDVLVYPVAASGISGYGGTPATVRGLFQANDELALDDGVPVSIQTERFETLKATAEANSMPLEGADTTSTSLVFDSKKFNLADVRQEDEFVTYYLQWFRE